MPTLRQDPLFHGPDDPCLLHYPQFDQHVGRGTVIVCPGGNYEFLSPLEGLPVVEWLASHGIGAFVLKYRLLPHYELDDALDDLEAAVNSVRSIRGGPVAALGFSAGGHLIASLALRCAERKQHQLLDAQVLVYPGIDGRDWKHPDYNGFFSQGNWKIPKRAAMLHRYQEDLLGGAGFAAPPTCLVGSTDDTCTPNEQHTDIYEQALERRGISHLYLRDAFGEHGFELKGGWTPGCAKWLMSRGFGGPVQAPGSHAMSLRRAVPRISLDNDMAHNAVVVPKARGDPRLIFPFVNPCWKHEELAHAEEIDRQTSIESIASTDTCFACTPAPQVEYRRNGSHLLLPVAQSPHPDVPLADRLWIRT